MEKTKEEIVEMAKIESKTECRMGEEFLFRKGYIKGYQSAQEEIIVEINRRVAIIISEPNGIVRETILLII